MKLLFDNDKIIVFLNNFYTDKIDFNDNRITEKFMHKLISKLKYKYTLDFSGYYDIIIYLDEIYGAVISIAKEELEYFDCFNGQIEMSIKVVKNIFLYELNELIESDLLNKFIIYKNKEVFYLRPKETISNIEMGKLLENTRVIFNQATKEIMRVSEIVKG